MRINVSNCFSNGNMITDTGKGVTSLVYNHLNLPTAVSTSQGTLNYTYDASGVKLQKTVGSDVTQYAGAFLYKNGTLEMIHTPEGYIEHDNGVFKYVYRLLDHLGNTRVSFQDSDGNGSIDPENEVVETNDYYPYGMLWQTQDRMVGGNLGDKFRYNGKEMVDDIGLDWYDFGARNYNPELGRWMNVDQLAEKYETNSPYVYALNTPINAIDPDGRLVVFVNGLLFNQAASYKLDPMNATAGALNSRYAYNPNSFGTKMWRSEPWFNGSPIDYWKGVDNSIAEYYGDNLNTQAVYFNGSHHFRSQASERFALGQKAGAELIANLQNGTIVLENEETIKIVGHSQGAAYAAGILTALMDSQYASRVEAGIYLSPHQPGDFAHPDGVFGMQFSTKSDWVSSRSGVKGVLMQLLNGGSDLSKIEGIDSDDYLHIRVNHDGGKGGHDVSTWESILKQIQDFLNCDEEDKNCN